MGFFDRLKGLFSGQPDEPRDDGIYLYVRLERSGEVVRLRLSPRHELVPDYEGGGFSSRKLIVGPQSLSRADATFRFDEGRNLVSWEIEGGELVTEEEWLAQQQTGGEDAPES